MHETLAELLIRNGWKSDGDAQWENLKNIIPEILSIVQDPEINIKLMCAYEMSDSIAHYLENRNEKSELRLKTSYNTFNY